MNEVLVSAFISMWLGILTSLGPCPMAINIAAISYIGKQVGHWRRVLEAGVLYTLGRMSVYITIGMLLATTVVASSDISLPLQNIMMHIMGPILLIVAMFLLDFITINLRGVCGISEKMQERADRWGILGAGLLGIIFALTFCPIAAALFFGSVMVLAFESRSIIIVPAMFGVGTALPVVVFALLIAFSAKSVGRVFKKMVSIEKWFRIGAGYIFIGIGLYMIARYTFDLF